MISRKQAWALLALTLMWGVNWPMMKLSLQETTPLMFRASTMLMGAGWLFFYVARKGERMWPAGREWGAIALLGLPNVLGWHTLSIFGVQELASGRAAILGFTMPIFTVLLGAAFFGERVTPRVRVAVLCAALACLGWPSAVRAACCRSSARLPLEPRGGARKGALDGPARGCCIRAVCERIARFRGPLITAAGVIGCESQIAAAGASEARTCLAPTSAWPPAWGASQLAPTPPRQHPLKCKACVTHRAAHAVPHVAACSLAAPSAASASL